MEYYSATKRKITYDTSSNMDKSQYNYAEWKQPGKNKYILYDSIWEIIWEMIFWEMIFEKFEKMQINV